MAYERHSRKGTRSQIKMGETIAILFIFFFIMAFGFVFYTRIQTSSIQDDIHQQFILRSIEVAQMALAMPELACSQAEVEEFDCFDVIKLEYIHSLTDQTTNPAAHLFYFDMFYYGRIYVDEIYPDPDNQWVIYEHGLPDAAAGVTSRIPVVLRDVRGAKPQQRFGVLTIESYE
ncbi:hypothetical protein JXB02_03865 [Candidatus Woesearchaeota archaeon]|nr:hypothetical protein [Candidatus Woesearchaeota archaeon]